MFSKDDASTEESTLSGLFQPDLVRPVRSLPEFPKQHQVAPVSSFSPELPANRFPVISSLYLVSCIQIQFTSFCVFNFGLPSWRRLVSVEIDCNSEHRLRSVRLNGARLAGWEIGATAISMLRYKTAERRRGPLELAKRDSQERSAKENRRRDSLRKVV